MQDSHKIMGNIKHGDDRTLMHDSYRIVGNVKYDDDDHTNAKIVIE
jgi:hypothetical protein